jgi:hypothetical protein
MYAPSMIERLATWAALGITLSALGLSATDWGFWCVIVLVWVATYLAYQEGREQGIWLTANLPIDALKDIKAQIAKIEAEEESNK